MKIYGIKNCDTCRKALRWLDGQGMAFQWHDLRADGLDEKTVRGWVEQVGCKDLVNRRSTTWRGLDPTQREAAMDPDQAVALILEYPTLVRRPLIEHDQTISVGFDEKLRQRMSPPVS